MNGAALKILPTNCKPASMRWRKRVAVPKIQTPLDQDFLTGLLNASVADFV
jgi:hypothetical protein